MVSLTCGLSLQKLTKWIAIADMVYCFFAVIVRTAISVVQAIYSLELPRNATIDKDAANSTFPFGSPNASFVINQLQSKSLEEPSDDLIELPLEMSSIFEFFVTMMVVMIAHIGFELWMCRLLLSASQKKDRESCKRWWWWRLGMTLTLLFMCIISTLVISRGWFSWFMEIVIVYRVYELYIVHLFKNDIAATTNISQLRNPE